MKNFPLWLALTLLLLSACSAANEPVSAPTASVYLLPMQQDTHLYTVQTQLVKLRAAPEGKMLVSLTRGEQVIANCSRAGTLGWCQIVEGTYKNGYLWQGCLDRPGGYPANEECR